LCTTFVTTFTILFKLPGSGDAVISFVVSNNDKSNDTAISARISFFRPHPGFRQSPVGKGVLSAMFDGGPSLQSASSTDCDISVGSGCVVAHS
jgi:hypothetical protein